MTPLAGFNESRRYTISGTGAARLAKRHEVVLLGRPEQDEEWNSEMRQDPPTDRAVRHRPDALPEGKPWIAKNSRE
jgi:hypothetical protein